jgi:uncharacterized protein involved in exopolysaccharide biosynthesis
MNAPAPGLGEQTSLPAASVTLVDLAMPVFLHWRSVVAAPLITGVFVLGVTFLIPNRYISRTVFLPPQQQQSAAATAVAQLGALSGLAGAAAGMKSPADQYVSLLQSATVSDRIIDDFKLMTVYDYEYRYKAREELADNVRISIGKKDGLITIEVEDESAQRAADMANRYVDELRRMTANLALTEAQQRRLFFEGQLNQTRTRLTQAQQALQSSGFSQGALRADAKASAEGYARLRAEVTAAEVRLQTLRRSLADSAPEVQQTLSALTALRSQLNRLESAADSNGAPDYVSKFREFKYQETMFELFARQYELARVDESREGALIQVVDEAKPAERKAKPRRATISILAALAALVAAVAFLLGRQAFVNASRNPSTALQICSLRDALHRHGNTP